MLCAGYIVGYTACASAYSGQATASNACQSGCKLELPAVEYRLRQVSKWLRNFTVTLCSGQWLQVEVNL